MSGKKISELVTDIKKYSINSFIKSHQLFVLFILLFFLFYFLTALGERFYCKKRKSLYIFHHVVRTHVQSHHFRFRITEARIIVFSYIFLCKKLSFYSYTIGRLLKIVGHSNVQHGYS